MATDPHTQSVLAPRPPRAILFLLLPFLIVIIGMALLIAVRDRAEAAVANFASVLPFGWAYAAGIVASVNPCGFFMLPAYLSYQLGAGGAAFQSASTWRRGTRAVTLGLVATSGFLLVLAAVGALTAVGARWLVGVFPYAGVAIGAGLAALGAWMLITHRTVGMGAVTRVNVAPQRSLRNVFLFGLAYAAGSLSCTLPVFLLVVGTSLASQGVAASFGQFISFGLGMGTILVAVTIGTALFRDAVAKTLRAALPYVHRISAFFLVSAGLYLVYYWVWLADAIL